MPRMLSKLAIAFAVIGGLALAERGSAQSYAPRASRSRQAYFQQSEAEQIAPGAESSSAGGAPPAYEESVPWDASSDDIEFMPEEFGYGAGPHPYDCDSLDCEADSLIPEGLWLNRGPLWYTSAAVTLLQKSAPSHQGTQLPVATLFEQAVVSGQVFTLRPVVMGTAGLDTNVQPGLRLTVGRNLFEDIIHRQHALEFTFIGLNHWNTNGVAVGVPGTNSPTLFRADNLWSFFPLSTPGFSNATLMKMSEDSAFNNFEINYRITSLPRPDRIAQMPDGRWVQVGTPCLTHSLLGGIRVLTFDDAFHWYSISDTSNGFSYGTYNVKSTNALVGAQLGGDLFANYNIFTAGIRGKAGVYHNLATQASDVQIVSTTGAVTSGAGNGSVGTTSFIGDLGLVTTARLSEQAYFRFSYDFLWVGGIANAPEQLQYTTDITSVVRKNGFLLFQGVSLGFDFCW